MQEILDLLAVAEKKLQSAKNDLQVVEKNLKLTSEITERVISLSQECEKQDKVLRKRQVIFLSLILRMIFKCRPEKEILIDDCPRTTYSIKDENTFIRVIERKVKNPEREEITPECMIKDCPWEYWRVGREIIDEIDIFLRSVPDHLSENADRLKELQQRVMDLQIH